MTYYKNINGEIVEMTPEEAAEHERQRAAAEAWERTRPYTEAEALSLLLRTEINAIQVDDNTALRMKQFYPQWGEGITYAAGDKTQYGDKLYRAILAHTSQADWTPDVTQSLYEVINETHAGTLDDPIPYDGNMALENGKYYSQEGHIYLCNRDTGNPVYNPLADLVGLYVELVA